MNTQRIKKTSKFLSLILRHKPQTIGLTLDKNGWADVRELLQKMNENSHSISMEALEIVVETNNKKRFSFNEDKTKIRANQGHSIAVDLELVPQDPPEHLYHGTVQKFVEQIKQDGLKKMSRQHVHLSKDKATAQNVGSRRGAPIILTIRAKEMQAEGYTFYVSENGVWLSDAVPVRFIDF